MRTAQKGGDEVPEFLSHSLFGAFLAALLGALIAFFNYTLAKKAALPKDGGAGSGSAPGSSSGPSSGSGPLVGAVPVLRMTLNVGFLVLVYFAAPHTPWDRTWLLAGAVAGLTLPLLVFTPLLVREVNRRSQKRPAGGESGPAESGNAPGASEGEPIKPENETDEKPPETETADGQTQKGGER